MAGPSGDTPLEDLSDEQLLAAHRAGREGAFEALVGRYQQELFHFLVRFSGNRASAEDLFQEAFCQVYLSADSFDVTKRFKPWLFTIAANKARDLLRKNNRHRTASLSAMMDANSDDGRTFIDLLEAEVPLPDTDAATRETAELVREAVAQMPEHLREVLVLAYFNRMAYKEIAEMLHIPLGTVKSRLHAAVGTFSQLWTARYGQPEESAPSGPASSS